MIPKEKPQTLETEGSAVIIGNFTVTDETLPRILVDLSDKLYTRKEEACVREYSTNAADAMVKAGKPLSEIEVTLPSYESLEFKVRDYGAGLSQDEITNVYCILGKSDKRNSNLYNGLFGYGCKCGFSHADSFMVTSWKDGVKTMYQCVKGDTVTPHYVVRLASMPSDEPSGIEVTIPVKQSSMWTFHNVASKFYRYWPELPQFNGLNADRVKEIEDYRKTEATLHGDGWEIRPANHRTPRGVAYMGYVAYDIDWDVVYEKMALDQRGRALFELIKSNNVTLFFEMGEVTFINNRESLEYTEETLKAVTDRLKAIFDKIKDSIQAKFEGIPNMWEAKKMYNAIFATGELELERGEEAENDTIEKVRILDGNLLKLEQTFRGQFTWNGLPVDGASFNYLNRVDNAHKTVQSENGYHPIDAALVTYKKKNLRVRRHLCSSHQNNRILASNHVAVVINDLGVRTGVQQVARYLIFRDDSKIKVVHMLKFSSQELHDHFNETFNFDTVPVQKLSDLIGPARQWSGKNKVSRSYGGGGGGRRMMRYFDLENKIIAESEVPVREIEDGGFFVEISENRRRVQAYKHHTREPDELTLPLQRIVSHLDLDIDRVYIINKQTRNAKWFQGAIASGDWINVWDHIEENLPALDLQTMVDCQRFSGNDLINVDNAKHLADKIFDKESVMLKFLSIVQTSDMETSKKIINALNFVGIWDQLQKPEPTVDYTELEKEINERYPLLDEMSCLRYRGVTKEELKAVATYINAMDLWIDLAPPAAEPQPKEAEELAEVA